MKDEYAKLKTTVRAFLKATEFIPLRMIECDVKKTRELRRSLFEQVKRVRKGGERKWW